MDKKKRSLSLRGKEILAGYLFISIWIVGFLGFFVINFFKVIQFSFNQIVFNSHEGGFSLVYVGLGNFRNIFLENADFNQKFTESMLNMLIDVPLILIFSLMIALMLNRKMKFRGMYRVIFFLPVILAAEAVDSAMEQALMAIMGGVSNIPDEVREGMDGGGVSVMYLIRTFSQFGIPVQVIEYLADAISRIYNIIRDSGVQIIIFLAALQSVPSSLYEVAKIEGATAYETFWKITFPLVSPLILTNAIYTIVAMYAKSEVVQLAYTSAFNLMNFGVGSAMSVVSSLTTCLILMAIGFLMSKRIYYRV